MAGIFDKVKQAPPNKGFGEDDGLSDWVTFHEVEVHAETEKALLIVFDGGTYWVPKSMINGDASEISKRGDVGAVEVRKWFVEKEGIE